MNAAEEQLTNNVAVGLVKETRSAVESHESLVFRLQDAKKALDLATSTIKRDWIDWIDTSKTILSEFRAWRMALDSEHQKAMTASADVRKFFMSEEHVIQMQRLTEFVNTCNQLKQLKESGFLDAVADTILKLDSK